MRVHDLVTPFEIVRFEVFDPSKQSDWLSLIETFQSNVEQLEQQAVQFIDESFRALRSSEGAFDLLQKYQTIGSRPAIKSTLMRKFGEIMSQFEKEVDSIGQLFQLRKSDPPIYKSFPKVAGAIHWSRSLFQKIKKSVLKFQVGRFQFGVTIWNYEVTVPLCLVGHEGADRQ